jgi:predicted nucleic acid-binding protein
MIFVDSGFLIALAKPRDALHRRAKAWTASINESVLLTEYVLCEIVDALSPPLDRPKAHSLISEFAANPDSRLIGANSELFHAGLKLHSERPDKEWSLTDCISFQVMREWGLRQALAYDERFEQTGFEALLRPDPAP